MQEMMVACFDIDHYCEHERSLFKEPVDTRGVICTKQPREVMFARMAMQVNPDLYIIYMVRDPRDVIVSRHAKQPDQYYASLSFYLRADCYAQQLINHPRFIAVRYEDLVRNPDQVQAEIAKKLTFLKFRHPFSEFHLHANVSSNSVQALNGVRPPDEKSIGKWRQHLPRVAAQTAKFPSVLDILKRYNYEPSDAWTRELPVADEKLAQSTMPDRGGAIYSLRQKWRVIRHCFWYWLKLKG